MRLERTESNVQLYGGLQVNQESIFLPTDPVKTGEWLQRREHKTKSRTTVLKILANLKKLLKTNKNQNCRMK